MAAPDPRGYPFDHLSKGSMETYLKCPQKWMYRYIESAYEPPSGAMVAGQAAGAAESENYQQKIETRADLSVADVDDVFNDEWKERVERIGSDSIEWKGDKPEDVRASTQRGLELYHERIAPTIVPLAVERKFSLCLDDMPWTFEGYIDLEARNGRQRKRSIVSDLKMKAKRLSPTEAAADIQPDSYLAARRAEGDASPRFDFHVMLRNKTGAPEIVPTTRSDQELDAFLQRILSVAADISLRLEYDQWQGAPPGAWWCSEKSCGYFDRCPFGGLARKRAAEATRAAGKAGKRKILTPV